MVVCNIGYYKPILFQSQIVRPPFFNLFDLFNNIRIIQRVYPANDFLFFQLLYPYLKTF